MNNRFDLSDDHALIRKALSDETWSAFDSELRDQALGQFKSVKRRRRARTLFLQLCAALVLASAASLLAIRRSAGPDVQTVSHRSERPGPPAPKSVISEQQMLAMFPPGSCLLAEIDGKKRLVFLDQKLATEGYPTVSTH